MTYLQPFFMLMTRAAVFWVGALALLCLTILTMGLAEPDAIIARYIDTVVFAAFAFPATAGWLAGAIVQEFQHCSFAWALPSVGRRLGAGYLATAAGVSLIVSGLATRAAVDPPSFWVLSALGSRGSDWVEICFRRCAAVGIRPDRLDRGHSCQHSQHCGSGIDDSGAGHSHGTHDRCLHDGSALLTLVVLPPSVSQCQALPG